LIRLPLQSLRVIGRGSAGVRLFNVSNDEHVVSAVRLADDGEDDAEEIGETVVDEVAATSEGGED
ncbi:MAG: gyrase subunit, partial [Pseudomonadota bacterium]